MVEYSCNIAPDLMGDFVENVASGLDTYSIRQPLGVRIGITLSCAEFERFRNEDSALAFQLFQRKKPPLELLHCSAQQTSGD